MKNILITLFALLLVGCGGSGFQLPQLPQAERIVMAAKDVSPGLVQALRGQYLVHSRDFTADEVAALQAIADRYWKAGTPYRVQFHRFDCSPIQDVTDAVLDQLGQLRRLLGVPEGVIPLCVTKGDLPGATAGTTIRWLRLIVLDKTRAAPHEIGHLIGLNHVPGPTMMHETLGKGTRECISLAELAQLFNFDDPRHWTPECDWVTGEPIPNAPEPAPEVPAATKPEEPPES